MKTELSVHLLPLVLSAARARGRLGGRPRGLPKKSEATAYAVETLYREGELSVMQIAKKLGISKSTLYKYLRFRNVAISIKLSLHFKESLSLIIHHSN